MYIYICMMHIENDRPVAGLRRSGRAQQASRRRRSAAVWRAPAGQSSGVEVLVFVCRVGLHAHAPEHAQVVGTGHIYMNIYFYYYYHYY